MKRNLSTCFFKKSWAHYSFGQMLVSGVLAIAITSSTIGASAVAATTLQAASGSSVSQSSSMVEATPAPTAEPEAEINTTLLGLEWYASSTVGEPAEPIPDIEVVLSTGGSQQKLSIGVYAEMEDENGYTWNEIIVGVPMEITIVCDELAELEDEDNETGHAASVEGAISIYDLNTSSGTFQLGEIDPGKYTVTLACEYDNYIMPDPVTVTVAEKISYEVDEDIEMEEEDAGFEDEGTLDDTVAEDTVRYVDSSSTSVAYTMYEVTSGEYWTSSTGDKYLYFTLNSGNSYYKSAYKITTATTTIDGTTYEYYASATLDSSLVTDSDGVVDLTASGITAISANTSASASTATTMQLATNYDNANFSGLTPLSLSVGSGASTGKAYSTISTLSTVTTTTLVVSSDSTSYGFMTINGEGNSTPITTTYTVVYEETAGKVLKTVENATDTSCAYGDDPTLDGYKFTGWSDAVSSDDGMTVTYTATWAKTYTVTYADGIDGAVLQTHTVVENEQTPAYSGDTPTRTDYTFDGWNETIATTVTADVTYTVKWKAVEAAATYTVSYTDGVDGTIFTTQSTSGLVSGAATPAFDTATATTDDSGNPTREGYTFAGWSPAVVTTVTGDATYTATWKENASSGSGSSSGTTDTSNWTQTVTLYSNGAASDSSVTINGKSYTASSLFGLSIDTVTVYTYSGWQTVNNIRYYYDPDTNEPVTGTQVINGTTYVFGSNGAYEYQCTGIDVSYWQGSIDWDKVKAAGVEFVIIRAGYRGYSSGTIVQDANFTSYITGAQAAGLRVGIYFFSQAINASEGVAEASACINLIKSYGTSYPIYIDTELSGASGNVGRADNISNDDRTAAVVAFCETIKSAGYTPGIYASYSWFTSKLNFSEVSGYSLWNAQWGSTNSMSSAGMWQYTSTGSVNGISGSVDMNVSYIG